MVFMVLLKKVFHALNSGGMVIIFDGVLGKGRSSRGLSGATASLLGLNLLVESGTQTYSFEEVSRWLGETGFTGPRRINVTRAPGFALILGTKPGAM